MGSGDLESCNENRGVADIPEPKWGGSLGSALGSSQARNNHGYSLGISSYGAPNYHKAFPWAEAVATNYDFALPQLYDASNTGSQVLMPRFRQWEQLGFTYVIPLLATYNKTGAQIVEYYKAMGSPSTVGWWDWTNTNIGGTDDWGAIKSIVAPVSVALVALAAGAAAYWWFSRRKS